MKHRETDKPDLRHKVVVMTGATSGIGQVAAHRLAALGARLVLVARDRVRGEAALARVRAGTPSIAHTVRYADLSRLADSRRVADEIATAEPRVDVLVNNAGAIFSRRIVTADGLEMTFALNHMSCFVLTAGLRDRLVAAAPSRVVITASNAHRNGHLDFADLQSAERYRAAAAYGTSKLCNILFTRELARRLADHGVTANCFSPGFVATRFGDQAGGLLGVGLRLAKLFAGSAEAGAETLVHLAASPNVVAVSGEFFYQCRPRTPTADGRDDMLARRLWQESERLALSAAALD
ncbi:MAG TPA: SDR family NAD(P)-dependent oxidoreductase [Xanthobacteraceae bacterium]|nr:SDR family NAD(P)-dependent oxidoreductase [Xanthobacteraceae bacterium]